MAKSAEVKNDEQKQTQVQGVSKSIDDIRKELIIELVKLSSKQFKEEDVIKLVDDFINSIVNLNPLSSTYNILIIYDSGTLQQSDTNRIYKAVTEIKSTKPILLILTSNGGYVSPAYFIAKLCNEFSDGDFQIAVPRQAKSAATLICCGAKKIHMGSLSELGPIDPQIDGIPALATKYSIEHLAELSDKYPKASEMFASYLQKSLKITELGHYERVAVSTVQYATRLLKKNIKKTDIELSKIASKLVYEYKDHGFAIDFEEAKEVFGSSVVFKNTPEYYLSNELYEVFEFLNSLLKNLFGYGYYFVGSQNNGCAVFKKN